LLDSVVAERIEKSMNHEEGDRVPIWDYIDNRAFYRHIAGDEPDYQRGIVKVYHEMQIDLCRGYGASFDADQNGTVHEHGESQWKISGQTAWTTRHPIRSLEDLKVFHLPAPDEEALEREWVPWIRNQQEAFAPYTMYVPGGGCGFHGTYGLMGLALFSVLTYDARDEIERLLWEHTALEVARARVAARHDLCPIYFIGDDVAYKGRTMFSPQFLRETFVRQLAAVCEPVKNAGMKVIFHTDGDVTCLVDDMIEAGIDGLNPIEPLAGMDIGYLKRRYGRSLILVGNVDCSQVLPLGSKEDVVEATKACLRAAAPGGGHFIGSSSEIVPATPVGNILAFYEACRTYGRYPINC